MGLGFSHLLLSCKEPLASSPWRRTPSLLLQVSAGLLFLLLSPRALPAFNLFLRTLSLGWFGKSFVACCVKWVLPGTRLHCTPASRCPLTCRSWGPGTPGDSHQRLRCYQFSRKARQNSLFEEILLVVLFPFSQCHIIFPLGLSASSSTLANCFLVLFPEIGSLVLGLLCSKYDLITIVVGETVQPDLSITVYINLEPALAIFRYSCKNHSATSSQGLPSNVDLPNALFWLCCKYPSPAVAPPGCCLPAYTLATRRWEFLTKTWTEF